MTDGGFTKTISVSVSPSSGGRWATPSDPAQDQPTVTPAGTVTYSDPYDMIFSASEDFEAGVSFGGRGAQGQPASGSFSDASIAFEFFWVPDFPSAMPPAMTYFSQNADAVAEERYYPSNGISGSASASDGQGDPQSTGSYPIDGTTDMYAASSGTKIVPVDTHTGTASITVKSLAASAAGEAGADVSASASETILAPPAVLVTAPSSGAIIMAGGDVSVSVHADPAFVYNANPSAPLVSVQLMVQGGNGGGGTMTPDADGNATFDLGTLPAGQYTATLEADYENFDGSMLPVMSAPVTFYAASFSVKTGSWNPNPGYVGEVISGQVQGMLDPSSIDGMGSGPDFVIYNWTTAGIWYSQDDTSGTFEPYGGNNSVSWTQGQASTTFNAYFSDVGFYILEVSCVATVYSQYTGAAVATFTQTGYIGNQSDIDTSGATGHAEKARSRTAHRMTAHAGGGGGNIPLDPTPVLIYVNNTAATNDDIVCVGDTTPCQVVLPSAMTSDVSVTLSSVTVPGGGAISITPSAVVIPARQTMASFTIGGMTGSTAAKDVSIHISGNVTGPDTPVTVFHFDNPVMTVNCPKSAGDGYPVPLKVAATKYESSSEAAYLTASVDLNPPGVDTSAPQIKNLSFGIVQNGDARTTTVGTRNPIVTWTHEPATGRSFSIKIPVSITDTQSIPGGSDALADAAPGWQSIPMAITARTTVSSKDNPFADLRERVANVPIIDTIGSQVGNVKYSVFAAINTSFKDWCCLYHSDTSKIEPLASCDWKLDVDSTDMNKRYGDDNQFAFPGTLTLKLPTCNDQLANRVKYPYVDTEGASDIYSWPETTPQWLSRLYTYRGYIHTVVRQAVLQVFAYVLARASSKSYTRKESFH